MECPECQTCGCEPDFVSRRQVFVPSHPDPLRISGGRGTRTHNSVRTTVFKAEHHSDGRSLIAVSLPHPTTSRRVSIQTVLLKFTPSSRWNVKRMSFGCQSFTRVRSAGKRRASQRSASPRDSGEHFDRPTERTASLRRRPRGG